VGEQFKLDALAKGRYVGSGLYAGDWPRTMRRLKATRSSTSTRRSTRTSCHTCRWERGVRK